MKRCSKCMKLKPKSEFFTDKHHTSDGLRSDCKACSYAIRKEWAKRNRQKIKAKSKRYREKHAEQIKEKWKTKYRSISSSVVERVKRWYAKHPEKQSAKNRNRHVATRGGRGKITAAEWQGVLDRYGRKCLYPGCERTDITMDHVIPLALGGAHSVDNVQPLCSSHNSSKSKKIADYRYNKPISEA